MIAGWQLRYRGYTISGQELDALAIVVEALQNHEKKGREALTRSQRARLGVIARNANLQSQN
jgi:hypothetical protein